MAPTVRTPAVIGQTYPIQQDLIDKALHSFDKQTLVLGMPPQWMHDRLYESAGLPFTTPESRYAVFDREVGGDWYDDKVCTFLNKHGEITGKRSWSHSVTYREEPVWEERRAKGIDTYIPSWDYVDNTHTAVIFRGILSYIKIREHATCWQGGYFNVATAREHCQAT